MRLALLFGSAGSLQRIAWLPSCGILKDTEPVYRALLDYAGAHGIDIIGNAYEERLIDEIASNEKSSQRIEIKIQIA